MQLKKLKPLELARWCYATLTNHIGSGDDAHAVADEEHNGFMSMWQVKQVNASYGYRMWAGNGVDLLQLEPGHYETQNPLNGPLSVNGFCEIDVTTSEGGMREVTLLQTNNGKRWYLSIDDGTKNLAPYSPKLWTYLARRVVLWSGSIGQVGQSLTLADDVTRYDWLFVTAHDNQNNYVNIKVYPQAGWFAVTGLSPSLNTSNPSTSVLKTTLSQVGNVLKIDKMYRYDSAANGGWTNNSGDAGLQIITVEGER